ncbi:MAG: hypothetical protein VXY99_14475, partial [Pseudomonadota bacterium]|nr:hypothetical protein [Pseudomonadota bacterium]
MSITAQQRSDLVLLVNGLFGAAPTSRILSNLVKLVESGNSVDDIATMFSGNTNFESIYAPALLDSEFATQFTANLLGAAATTETTARAEALVTTYLTAGMSRTEAAWKVTKLLSTTEDADFATAKAQLNNKADVSLSFALDTQYTELMTLSQLQSVISSVTSDAATVTTAKAAVAAGTAVSGSSTGETFTLTANVDTVTGTSNNDTIVAQDLQNNNAGSTLSFGALDTIDGGAGSDTLNILDQTNAINVSGSNVSNVETVNIQGAAAVTANTSNWSGVEALNVTQSGGATTLTAAATTDVAASGLGDAATAVTGGKDVSVTQSLDNAADSIAVNGAAGDVTVTATNSAAAAGGITLGATTANAGAVSV